MRQRPKLIALAGVALLLAVMPVVAGCQGNGGSAPAPASFSPSPCPPGWHRIPDPQDPGAWSCFISGTLKPGQQLPLPVISGTRLPMPVQLPSPDGSPGATLAAYARPAS